MIYNIQLDIHTVVECCVGMTFFEILIALASHLMYLVEDYFVNSTVSDLSYVIQIIV